MERRYLVPFVSLVCFVLLQWMHPCCSLADDKKQSIREAAYEGSWYPGSKSDLEVALKKYLEAAQGEEVKGKIVALISPHAGYAYSAPCAAYAYNAIMKKDYNRVFILGFSHRFPIQGAAVSDFDLYETPLGEVRVDTQICKSLLQKKLFLTNRIAEEQEHSIELQLPFLQTVLKDFTIVPVMVGELKRDEDYKAIATALKEHIDARTLIVVSSDMTHYGPNYGYIPFRENVRENLKPLDTAAISKITSIDFKGFQSLLASTGDTICGDDPIGVLLNLIDKRSRGILLKYSTSGEILRDFKNSVSYAAIAFVSGADDENNAAAARMLSGSQNADGLSKEEQKLLLKLARETITGHLTGRLNKDALVNGLKLTEKLQEKRGVFVTIKKHGELRGCIGYIQGIAPLYQAVIENAISASTKDYRFPPMTAAETNGVKLEISVMTPLMKIHSADEVQVGKHGLCITYAGRHGVLLPQVATESRWNRDEFLSAVCKKAGLPADTWNTAEPELWVFSAQVFGEE